MNITKTNKAILVFTLIAISILTACKSTIPFTNTVRTQYSLDEAKLKRTQFYISRSITLQRGERTNEATELDADGKLIISSSANLDVIEITAKTPGVCLKVLEGNKLAVSFDSDDSKYLVFGDPNNTGRYNLMGAEWKNSKGKINYGGKVYYIMPGGAAAYLKFEMKKYKNQKTTSSRAKGRKV